MNEIQEFYNQHHFPGYYTIQSITKFDVTTNRYVNTINGQLSNGQRVLDVGCGTGLLTNLFAAKYKKSQFTGLDFSTAVDYAKDFAKRHDIKNVKYIKKDFFEFENNEKYDVIIAQSFLTHVPNWPEAVKKLKSLLTQNGVILLGVYHPAGKLAKKFINVNYKNDRLELDQESNPFEVAYTKKQVRQMFSEFKFLQITPSVFTKLVGFVNIFNYKNGGLTVYALTRK
jgi:ubiquinone/menaquinone biosynthesis C-methylase UbiE